MAEQKAYESERKEVWTDAINQMLTGRYRTHTNCDLDQLAEGAIEVADAILEAYDTRFPKDLV